MANVNLLKSDASANVKILADYLRKQGLIGSDAGASIAEPIRDFRDEQEEVLFGQLLASRDLARRLADL